MYPISYEADFNPTPNRATTFFRIILAIPWIIVALRLRDRSPSSPTSSPGSRWSSLGRYPEGLYNFNSGVVRFVVRIFAWVYLQTDEWPPFGLADDPNYPIRVNIAPRGRAPEPAQGLLPDHPGRCRC